MANLADAVPGSPLISIPTSIDLIVLFSGTPSSSACFMCHSIHDSQSMTAAFPMGINSNVSSQSDWKEINGSSNQFPHFKPRQNNFFSLSGLGLKKAIHI